MDKIGHRHLQRERELYSSVPDHAIADPPVSSRRGLAKVRRGSASTQTAERGQGGIRVPCIVRYLPMFDNPSLKPGDIKGEFQTCMDIMPTLLELSGTTHPAAKVSPAPYKGRMVVKNDRTKLDAMAHRRQEAYSRHDRDSPGLGVTWSRSHTLRRLQASIPA